MPYADEKAGKRERYKSLREAGVCTLCGNAPARPGRGSCEACAQRHAAYQRQYKGARPEHKAPDAARKREIRAARKAAGLCYSCGQRAPAAGKLRCAECAEYHLEHARALHKRHPLRARSYSLKFKVGITLDEKMAMLAAQGGRCAICGRGDSGRKDGRWHVDHDHATGAVRGVLCNGCNVGLGAFRDDPIALQRAVRYLVIKGGATKEKQAPLGVEEGA